MLFKKERNASAKSIDPGQPAQSAQTDLGRSFSLTGTKFPYALRPAHSINKSVLKNKEEKKKFMFSDPDLLVVFGFNATFNS